METKNDSQMERHDEMRGKAEWSGERDHTQLSNNSDVILR